MEIKTADVSLLSHEEFIRYYERASQERRRTCDTRKDETAKRCCILAEALAREMIAAHCGCTPESVCIRKDETGRPYTDASPLHFSLSHSGTTVVCAISHRRVGVDVEAIRPVSKRTRDRVCAQAEKDLLAQAKTSDEQDRLFIEMWTKKEAYFKAFATEPFVDTTSERFKSISCTVREENGILITTVEEA